MPDTSWLPIYRAYRAGQCFVKCGIFFKFVVPLRQTRTCWIFQFCCPTETDLLWLHRSLALPSRNTPWKFQLDTYKTFENIAVTWAPLQIKANWPARPISGLYFTWFWLINVAKPNMYLPAYLPGVSILVCRVCMLNMNARFLMVTHLQGLPGRSVFR